MEILVTSNENPTLVPISSFDKSIKFVAYRRNQIIILTNTDEIYQFNIDYNSKYEITKLENLPFTNIKQISCIAESTIIVNEKDEIFIKGIFYDRGSDKEFIKVENVSLKEKIKYLRLGENYFLILTTNNSLFGFGDNKYGQLGLDREVCLVVNVIDKENFNDVLLKKIDNISLQIKDVQCSETHSMILDIFGNVFVTGNNGYGQLGLGDCDHRFKFTKVELPFKVIKIYADNVTSFIVNENNELYGTGYNESGQLGLGDCEHTTVFTKITIPNFNTNYYGFSFSYQVSSFLVDGNNKVFITGGYKTDIVKFGLKVPENDCLVEFKELNMIMPKRKYINVLPVQTNCVFFICSDYKINEEEKENLLGFKIFQKLLQKQLIDITVICSENY